VLDGVYRPVGAAVRYTPSVEAEILLLHRAVDFIRAGLAGLPDPAALKQQATKAIPELKGIWDLIPQKRSEAYAVLAIIVSILLWAITRLCDTGTHKDQKPEDRIIFVPAPVCDALPPAKDAR
jgi:hypothetical protein